MQEAENTVKAGVKELLLVSKEERQARLMALQEEISAARLERKIGRTLTVLVDEVDEEGAVARSHADAPEIDGLVYIEDGQDLQPGDWVEVEVTDADEHDLWAELALRP